MELNVWVEGVPRAICGVTEATTCEEVIYLLAQTASLPGFYTLVAKWRGNEITLAPEEKPLVLISSLRETPNNFVFILRRLEATPQDIDSHNLPRTPTSYPRQFDTGYQPMPSVSLQAPSYHSNPPAVSRFEEEASNPAGHMYHSSTFERHDQTSYRKPEIADAGLLSSSYLTPNSSVLAATSQASEVDVNPWVNQVDVDLYNQLKEQMSNQEQETEWNRLCLLQLDKEIAQLENAPNPSPAGVDDTSQFAVGAAAELAQLASTPWPRLLENYRKRQQQLLAKRTQQQGTLKECDAQISQVKTRLDMLENRLAKERPALLEDLALENKRLRETLQRLKLDTTTVQSHVNESAGVLI